MFTTLAAFAAGFAVCHFWPEIKAKFSAWYEALKAKV